MCPKGIINIDELPARWGLMEIDGNKIHIKIGGPKGNIWNDINEYIFPERNILAEWNLLYSALRRVNL